MTQTYTQMQKEIRAMTDAAQKQFAKERAEVIAKMLPAMEFYDIAPSELTRKKATSAKGAKSAGKAKAPAVAARYRDAETGNVWVGRGPRPQWIRDALAAGKSLSDFQVGHVNGNGSVKTNGAGAAAKKPVKATRTKKAKYPPKYKDGAGNAWSGQGSQPKWLRALLAQGKTLDDFAVH